MCVCAFILMYVCCAYLSLYVSVCTVHASKFVGVYTCLYTNAEARGLCPDTSSTPLRKGISRNWKIYFSYAGEFSGSALFSPPWLHLQAFSTGPASS